MKSPGSCKFFVHVPSLADAYFIRVDLHETVSDLIKRLLGRARIPLLDPPSVFHLYCLDEHYRMLPDEAPCASLFLSRYRMLTLQSWVGRRVLVFFDGREAEIDLPPGALNCDLAALAVQCFNISTAGGERYLVIDAQSLRICRVDDIASCSIFIFMPVCLYANDVVFTCNQVFDRPSCSLFLIVKTVLAAPMRALFALLEKRREHTGAFAEFTKERLTVVLAKFHHGEKLDSTLSEGELNGLVFLLLALNPRPFLSSAMAKFAREIMEEPTGVRRFEQLQRFILLLPLETHAVLSELSVAYDIAAMSEGARAVIVALVDALIFSGEADPQFITDLLLWSPSLFLLPAKPGRELRVCGPRLIIFDRAVPLATADRVAKSDTKPFIPQDFASALRGALPPDRARRPVALERLDDALAGARGKPARPKPLDAGFDFEAIFGRGI